MEARVAQDQETWEELYASGERPDRPLSDWVVCTVAVLPNGFPLADIAGGTGRHAVPAALGGRPVVLVDFIERPVALARERDTRVNGVVAEVAHLPAGSQFLCRAGDQLRHPRSLPTS